MNLTKLFQIIFAGLLIFVLIFTSKYSITDYQGWIWWFLASYLLLLTIKQTELTIYEQFEDPVNERNKDKKNIKHKQ